MSITQSNTLAHNATCNVAEGTRQVSEAAAAQSAAGQVTANNAAITWARAVIASANTSNGGNGIEPARTLLVALGTGGV